MDPHLRHWKDNSIIYNVRVLDETQFDVIWPSLLRHSWSGKSEFPYDRLSMKIAKDWAWKFRKITCLFATNEAPKQVLEQSEAWRMIEGMVDQVQSFGMLIGASHGLLGRSKADYTCREKVLEMCDRSELSLIDQKKKKMFSAHV